MQKSSAKTAVPKRTQRDRENTALAGAPSVTRAERKTSNPRTRRRFAVQCTGAGSPIWRLRLELDGQIASFELTSGLPLNASERKPARCVAVDSRSEAELDLSCGDEGVDCLTWDIGGLEYAPAFDANEPALLEHTFEFELHGSKLRARYELSRATDETTGWSLRAVRGAFGAQFLDPPRSVFTGLTLAEAAARARIVDQLERAAEACGAARGRMRADTLVPMLCRDSGAPLTHPDWLYELKLDGVRVLAEKSERGVELRYRSGLRVTQNFPEIARAVAALPARYAILDGEITTRDEHGRPSFQRLATRMLAQRPAELARAAGETAVIYSVFDVIGLGSWDLRAVPLRTRKQLLAQLIRGRGLIEAHEYVEFDGRALLDRVRAEKLEGIVAKRASSPYRTGPQRSGDWVKFKTTIDGDFVVVGFFAGRSPSDELGALCLASYTAGRLLVRGNVGSGLTRKTSKALLAELERLRIDRCAADGAIAVQARRFTPVAPKLVVSVRYTGFTTEGRLRAPVLLGVRPDMSPQSCTSGPNTATSSDPTPRSVRAYTHPTAKHPVDELCAYYERVWPALFPTLRGRAVRCQPDPLPASAGLAQKAHDSSGRVDDLEALLALVRSGVRSFEIPNVRMNTPECADWIVLDPLARAQPAEWMATSTALREILEQAGFESQPITCAAQRLRVIVPLPANTSVETAELLARLLIDLLDHVKRARNILLHHVKRARPEERKRSRATGAGLAPAAFGRQTMAAPYSLLPGTSRLVAIPLTWNELDQALDPARHDLQEVERRFASGDPPSVVLVQQVSIENAIERLTALVARAGLR